MNVTTKFSFIYLSLLSLFLYGCSYNNVYEIDKKNGSYENIEGIQDLYNSGAKNVNIVFIHGMGHHPQDDEFKKNGVTRLYQNRLAVELGFNNLKDNEIPWTKELNLRNSSIVGGKLNWRHFDDGDGKTLNMFALSWDEVTVAIQKVIFELDDDFYERGGNNDREKDRVILNRELKRFINRSFADPAIYLGSFGKEIRYLVAQGIVEIDSILERKKYLNNPKTDQIVIIADSLGSSVTFDTIKETKSINKEQHMIDSKSAVQRFASLSTLIFMNANQLPLIELGRIEAPIKSDNEQTWLANYPCTDSTGSTGILGFTDVRKNSFKQLEPRPELQLVAFSDPNDALSYYLTERFKTHCSGEKVKIINVLLTNAKWNYLFLLANPAKAHAVGFKTNDKSIDIIVHGIH